MSLINTLLTALRSVTANKLRATLTTLGVIIGVTSVIATLALGNGARAAVDANFRFLGSDQIQINAAYEMKDGELEAAGKKLTFEDGLLMTDAVNLIDRAEMSIGGSVKVRHGRAALDVSFTGADADALNTLAAQSRVQPVGWPEGKKLTPEAFIARGRSFTPAEALAQADVCILAHQTAQDLFEGDEVLGEIVWINRRPCEVIAVLTELEPIDPDERNRSRVNDGLFLPISTAIRNLYEEEPSVNIIAHVTDPNRMDEAKAQIAEYLRQRHTIEPDASGAYEYDFRMTTKKDMLGAQQEAARTFSLLLTALAAVSLVVGGIGIMNVMLVSVTERTREIGVRMAIGARRRDIVAQFLTEAVVISASGGVLGIAAGVLSIPVAATFNKDIVLFDPRSIPLALGVALLTGVVFGLYPALRASRLNPIEALRYE